MKRLTIKVIVEDVKTYGTAYNSGEASMRFNYSPDFSPTANQDKVSDMLKEIIPIMIFAAEETNLEEGRKELLREKARETENG